MNRINIIDVELITQFSVMLVRSKIDHSGRLVNVYMNDTVISAILEALYWLPNTDNNVLGAMAGTPRIISGLVNLIICVHLASAWAAYLLSALLLLYERLPDEALDSASVLINSASRLIMNGQEDNVDGCLLLINNMTALGGDNIASHVANHWDLMNELKRSLKADCNNSLRMRRIASIFHHLSRCERAVSILVSNNLPRLLEEVHAAAMADIKSADTVRQEFPLHLGLLTLALANLSPVTRNQGIKCNPRCLQLIVKFLKHAKDGKSYHGIYFRVADILIALQFLCSDEENTEGLVEGGILDILQQLLRIVSAPEMLGNERGRVPVQIDVKLLLKLLVNLVQKEDVNQRVVQMKLSAEVEHVRNSSDIIVRQAASHLLWLIRDRDRCKQICHQVISSIQRMTAAFDVDNRPRELIQTFLAECNLAGALSEACQSMATTLSLTGVRNEQYTHLRGILASLQENFSELERSSNRQLNQMQVEKELLRHNLEESTSKLAAERDSARALEAELNAVKKRLDIVDNQLLERTRKLDEEKRLAESLRLDHIQREKRLPEQQRIELNMLQSERVKELQWAKEKDRAREIRESVCVECNLRKQAREKLIVEAKNSDNKASEKFGIVRRALEEDVDGLTHLLISAASPVQGPPIHQKSIDGDSLGAGSSFQVRNPRPGMRERAVPRMMPKNPCLIDAEQEDSSMWKDVYQHSELNDSGGSPAVGLLACAICSDEGAKLNLLMEDVLKMQVFLHG